MDPSNTAPNRAIFNDQFGIANKDERSKGEETIRGYVKYYRDLPPIVGQENAENGGWQQGQPNDENWGRLWYSKVKPKGWTDTGAVPHSLSVVWNCCKGIMPPPAKSDECRAIYMQEVLKTVP